ncbi:MAG: oxidoreductase, partial [Acidobacteria bacterium]|nr:oxidoreductase [Acidobacteriota bacterium]
VYAPDVVAEAILRCAERRVRDVTVGRSGRMLTLISMLAPRSADKYVERAMFRQQRDPERPVATGDSLYAPTRDGRTQGPYRGHVLQSSAYTQTMLSDVRRVLPYVAAGVALAAGIRRWS